MAILPLVGAEAVILGMAAFVNNARTVNSTLIQLGRTTNDLERASSRSMTGLGQDFAGAAQVITRGAQVALGAILALAAGSIVLGQRYGKDLAFVGAISESTSKDIALLNDVQLELSRSSTQGALSLQQISAELLKAGQSMQDVTGGALQAANAMVVASNGELEAARAASIVQVATAAFSDKLTTAKEAANAATAAVQGGTLSFTGYADAIRQGGGVAAQQGLSIQEFSAIVGVASQQLTSGTEIGTGFRQMLQRLRDPTAENIEVMNRYGISLYDAQGAARPFIHVFQDLEKAFGKGAVASGKITQAARDQALATLFLGRTSRIVAVLLDEGTDKYLEFLAAAHDTDVFKIAAIILSDTANVLTQLGNNAATAGIALNQGLDPYINTVATSFLKLVQAIDLVTFKNLGDVIGSTVYNAFANLGQFMSANTVPAFQAVIDGIGNVISSVINLGHVTLGPQGLGAWQAYMNYVGPAAELTAKILMAAFNLCVDALNGLAGAIDAGTVLVETYRSAVMAVVEALITNFVGAIQTTISNIMEFVSNIRIAPEVLEVMRIALIVVGTALLILGAAVVQFGRIVVTNFQYAWEGIQSFGAATWRLVQQVGDIFTWLATNSGVMTTNIGHNLHALLGNMTPLGRVVVLLADAWAKNWSGIAGVVGRAVNFIARAAGALINRLAELPIIGEMIGNVQAAFGVVEDFFAGIPSFAASAGEAVSGFVATVQGGMQAVVSRVQNTKLPTFVFTDFAAVAKASFDNVKTDRDALLRDLNRKSAVPEPDTDPGSIPGGGGDGGAAKKAADALANAFEKAEELQRDFNEAVRKETLRVSNDIVKIYANAGADMVANMEKASKDIAEAIADADRQIRDLHTERAIEQDTKDRTDALEGMLEEESRIRGLQQEDIEVAHDREVEAGQQAFDELQEIARREYDERLALAARNRDDTRRQEDADFDRTQRRAETAFDKLLDQEGDALKKQQAQRDDALKKEQDAEERGLSRIQDAREAEQQTALDAEERALKGRQDVREKALQAALDAESRQRDEARDIGEINRKDTEARAKAEAEYTKELSIGVKQSIAQARFNEKIAKIQEETQADREQFERRKAQAAVDLEFEASQQAKLNTLRAEFEQEDLALKTKNETALKLLRESNENAMLVLRADHARQEVELRARAEEEITKQHEDHERRRLAFTIKQDDEARDRSRGRAEEDRIFAEEQERDKRKFIDAQEKAARDEARKVQDAERVRRNKLDIAETAFKKEQDEKRAALTKTLDDEAFERKLSNIGREHLIRINQIEATLAEEQQKTRDKLAQDLIDLDTNLKERIETMRGQFVDKLEAILREGGEQIRPLVDTITSQIADGLNDITVAAEGAKQALEEALGASEALKGAEASVQAQRDRPGGSGGAAPGGATIRPGGKPGETLDEAVNYLTNVGAAASREEALKQLGFQYGGTVPGKFGQPVHIIAHGGERFEGIGAHSVMLTAVRMAESMMARNVLASGGTATTNYTVNANYGREQSEGSISRDLSALVALTRK